MAKTLQFRRDTTTNLASVTGASGELFVDTTKNTVVVMDGSTAGGFPLALEGAGGGLDNVTSNTAGIFFDATATTSSTFTLVSGFSNDYMSGSSATWSDNNVMITGTSGNNNAAQLLDLVVGDTLTVDFGAGAQVLTLSSVFTVTPGMFPSYTATVVENSPSMSFMQGDIVADHSASTTITPLIIDGTGTNISVGTIGTLYVEENIVTPLPSTGIGYYGLPVLVNEPLIVNGSIDVVGANGTSTATVTNLFGYNSGGVNNSGQLDGNGIGNWYVDFNDAGYPAVSSAEQYLNVKVGDIITGTGSNGFYTGTIRLEVIGDATLIRGRKLLSLPGANFAVRALDGHTSVAFGFNSVEIEYLHKDASVIANISTDDLVATNSIVSKTTFSTDSYTSGLTVTNKVYASTNGAAYQDGSSYVNLNIGERNEFIVVTSYIPNNSVFNLLFKDIVLDPLDHTNPVDTLNNNEIYFGNDNSALQRTKIVYKQTASSDITFGNVHHQFVNTEGTSVGSEGSVTVKWLNNTPPTTLTAQKIYEFDFTFHSKTVDGLQCVASFREFG